MWTCSKVNASSYKTPQDPRKISKKFNLWTPSLKSARLRSDLEEKRLPWPSRPPCLFKDSEIWSLLVLVVCNKFSGTTPKSRSAWQRKISSAITTQGPDYLYKIMNLFLYMPIISPKREFINVDFFFLLGAKRCSRRMCLVHENVWGMWKAYTRSLLIQSD